MEMLGKAAAISVTVAVLSLVIKKQSPDMALLLGIAACCAVLTASLTAITEVTDFLQSLLTYTGLDGGVVSVVLKATGVAILSKLASDVCRDAGESALASSVEVCGSVTVLCIALPLIKAVMQMINSLIR